MDYTLPGNLNVAEILMNPTDYFSTDDKNGIEITHDIENPSESTRKSFKEQLDEIPIYKMTRTQLCNIYLSIRERNKILKTAFCTGEYCAKALAEKAKPIVVAVSYSAMATVKPFIGEVNDPAGKLDAVASEALSRVEKKYPVVRQDPMEIVESTKKVIQDTTASYIEKLHGTAVGKTVLRKLDNAISFSELIMEFCFPSDGSSKEDMEELDQAEEDEAKGVLVRMTHLKDRLKRRGLQKLKTIKPFQFNVDANPYTLDGLMVMKKKFSQDLTLKEGAQNIFDVFDMTCRLLNDNVFSTSMYMYVSIPLDMPGLIYKAVDTIPTVTLIQLLFKILRIIPLQRIPMLKPLYYKLLWMMMPDIPGASLLPDIPGLSLLPDIPGASLLPDIPGASLLPDIPGASLLPF